VKRFRFLLAIVLTTIVTFVSTSYFTSRNTRSAFVARAYDMEAFNELHRIESWDRVEKLLVQGCNKEALEYVRMEQSLGLSSLKWHLDNGARLERAVEESNRSIVSRAKSFSSKGKYEVPAWD